MSALKKAEPKGNGITRHDKTSSGKDIDKQKVFTDVVGRLRTIGQYVLVYCIRTKGTASISVKVDGISLQVKVMYEHHQGGEAHIAFLYEITDSVGIYGIALNICLFSYCYCKAICHE